MNKNDINRKGNQNDHSFRNIYKFEISGLLGNNYDELSEDNLNSKVSLKGFLLKLINLIIFGIIFFFFLKKGMWSTDTRTAVINSLLFIGATLIVSLIGNIIIDSILHNKKK